MVVEEVRQLPGLTCMLGNHDAAILGRMELSAFNGDARRSLTWTSNVLSADNMDFLRTLPHASCVRGDATLAHGSPRDPVWEYILNTLAARLNFEHFSTPFCFVGHSHIQSMFHLDEKTDRVSMALTRVGEPMVLQPRTIVNPGSVGQPRDRDPRAAYAMFDTETRVWEARRVAYDVPAVQGRVREAGLPEKHAARLAEGW
jgi:diadenosine tetraphosphatase ApaH/serine/threonine PP2A family protein phosphatase